MPKTKTGKDEREGRRRYYQEHKEIIKARSRKWRRDNRARVLAYRREYSRTHRGSHPRNQRKLTREEILARNRRDYATHKAQFRKYRERRIARDREGYLKYHCNYWWKNRKRLLAQKKKYREDHREEINAKKREAWRKKAHSRRRGKWGLGPFSLDLTREDVNATETAPHYCESPFGTIYAIL